MKIEFCCRDMLCAMEWDTIGVEGDFLISHYYSPSFKKKLFGLYINDKINIQIKTKSYKTIELCPFCGSPVTVTIKDQS
jgi:hypothetical protein